MKTAEEKVIQEIQYFVSCCALKRMLEQGKITSEYCQQANAAIAKKCGVPIYTISYRMGEKL